jgi:hypothetical protein
MHRYRQKQSSRDPLLSKTFSVVHLKAVLPFGQGS